MITIEPEHRKYFNKFGTTKGSSIDWRQENKPLARCTLCVMRYGDMEKTDNLVLETRKGVGYLCCRFHRRKQYGKPS